MTFASRTQQPRNNLRLWNDSSNEFLTRSNVNTLIPTSSTLAPDTQSNESHTRSEELRARSKFTTHESHTRVDELREIRNSRSRSTADRQPPCSASTTTRSRGNELNGAPLPCLPCFCSVSCAQGMTFCSTLKGCATHHATVYDYD